MDAVSVLTGAGSVVGLWLALVVFARFSGFLRGAEEDSGGDEDAESVPDLIKVQSEVTQLRLDVADLTDRVDRWRRRDAMRAHRARDDDGNGDPTTDPRVKHLPSAYLRLKKLAQLDAQSKPEE